MVNFELECVEYKARTESGSFGRFVSHPLEVGQGITIGNVLRRVLLKDLSGLGIVGVRIGGIKDQFSILSGVREDVLEILLNLKEIVLMGQQQKESILRLKIQGPGIITAGKFNLVPNIEIVNPHQYIATISDTSFLEIEVKVAWGQGYTLAKNLGFKNENDYLDLDVVFMPVKKVVFQTQHRFTETHGNQEQLILDIWTNGSLSPKEAVVKASKIIVNWFIHLEKNETLPLLPLVPTLVEDNIDNLPIEELHLSVRAFNGLKRAQIHVVGDLLQSSISELKKIQNFGTKSLNEVISVLEKHSKVLKD